MDGDKRQSTRWGVIAMIIGRSDASATLRHRGFARCPFRRHPRWTLGDFTGQVKLTSLGANCALPGAAVPVGGRAFQIIEILAQSAGELVTKDELISRAAPDIVDLLSGDSLLWRLPDRPVHRAPRDGRTVDIAPDRGGDRVVGRTMQDRFWHRSMADSARVSALSIYAPPVPCSTGSVKCDPASSFATTCYPE